MWWRHEKKLAEKNIWMTALPVVLVNTVVRGYWVLLLSWPNGPNGPMYTCATAHDLRSLTSIAWNQPGHSVKRFFNRMYLLFFIPGKKILNTSPSFFIRIIFSDRFLFVLNKCDYNLQNSMTRCNLTKNKQVFFSTTWKNPISKR